MARSIIWREFSSFSVFFEPHFCQVRLIESSCCLTSYSHIAIFFSLSKVSLSLSFVVRCLIPSLGVALPVVPWAYLRGEKRFLLKMLLVWSTRTYTYAVFWLVFRVYWMRYSISDWGAFLLNVLLATDWFEFARDGN